MVKKLLKRGKASLPANTPRKIQNSPNPKISVVIPVMNELRTLGRVIREARAVHPRTEVIVVANGSRDGSKQLAQRMGARVYSYKNALGHDVGRSIGARNAKGDIILFTDGDIVIPASQFRRLTDAVSRGTDIALNKYNGITKRHRVHSVILSKHALNAILNVTHLKGASLTAIPHAMSRKAVETIGPENLSVPPKAQAIAVMKGLKLRAVHHIDVGKKNPLRRRFRGKDPLEKLILGDHLEAVHYVLRHTDPRGQLSDGNRRREEVK